MSTLKVVLLSAFPSLFIGYQALAQEAGPALSAADKAAIETTLGKFRKNLGDHQFAEMPAYTTPDISFVNVVGMFWQGEADVQRAHQAIFDRIYKGAALPPAAPGNLTFRAITPDVVLVTSRSTMPVRSDGPPPAGAPPAAAESIFNTLLVKRQGRWLITAGQNTPVDARAAAANPIR
ncbi:SgcJ/EcaC family oxidoreductase [Hymenobacter sp. UV11]|uniref:SgcJ/EcaC family oxidoreductase n=1 Tax=Hymenobacter sp. UV11 TaxID=1849735 RepID=UPI00105BD5DF|nr:SgcJ/EcaC family oxidoreductase [Hymenobacter sp. UV11]TDN38407.1 hypothetical protein A8B98_23935 [Hymenobacter sp. UV11]TFZ67990.1 SgcJ/EcaC family oxidoreductase [Hymenobacter sp. UV11]